MLELSEVFAASVQEFDEVGVVFIFVFPVLMGSELRFLCEGMGRVVRPSTYRNVKHILGLRIIMSVERFWDSKQGKILTSLARTSSDKDSIEVAAV